MDSEVEQKILDNLRNCSVTYIQEHTIALCQKCSGTGFYEYEEMVDYHKHEHPELKALTYSNYDDMVRIIEIERAIGKTDGKG